jgi:hypothetical protein
MLCSLTALSDKYNWNNKVDEDDMSRTCSTQRSKVKFVQRCGTRTTGERPDGGGKIILNRNLDKYHTLT